MSANVNKPVDIKQKENDINRKLQIYGIFNAFKNGKTPSVCILVYKMLFLAAIC